VAISFCNKGLLRLARNKYMIPQETILALAEDRTVMVWRKKIFFD